MRLEQRMNGGVKREGERENDKEWGGCNYCR